MDVANQSEIILRDAGYDTWPWAGANPPVLCFENATIVGFLHVFDTAADLIARWEEAQGRVLLRHAAALRAAGTKAWNVYSVFLTRERSAALRRHVERLEEDFSLTRKIARSGILLVEDLEHALMPLMPIKANPLLADANVEDRVRQRAKDVSAHALQAFLGPIPAEEVAAMLGKQA